MLNPIRSLALAEAGDVELAPLGDAAPREAPREAARSARTAWWQYEPEGPAEEVAFAATLGERLRFAARHPRAHLRGALSLQASIVAWTGLWDLCTYCGIAAYWADDPRGDDPLSSTRRNAALAAAGLALQFLLDVFHGNAIVPGEAGGRLSRFWDRSARDPKVRWLRALGSFAGQVALTCGMYNLLSGEALFPRSFARDVLYAVLGLGLAAAVDDVYAYCEMTARARAKGGDAASKAASDPGFADAPARDAPGARETRCCCGLVDAASDWDLSYGTPTQRPDVAYGLAAASYVGQVLIWVGFDACLCSWPYGGVRGQYDNDECLWGCALGDRAWYHEVPIMAAGLAAMFASGTLLHFSFVADRFDKRKFPHVMAWLPVPDGPPNRRALARAFARSIVAMAGYYAHLSAFWYLVDEDLATAPWAAAVPMAPDSNARNVAYLAAGLAALYASGCFWADTGV